MKESKKMVGKEVAFMKKMGAPKSMIKHEKAEAGMHKMPNGKMMKDSAMKKMAHGGMTKMGAVKHSSNPDGLSKVPTKGKMVTMKMGGKTR